MNQSHKDSKKLSQKRYQNNLTKIVNKSYKDNIKNIKKVSKSILLR